MLKAPRQCFDEPCVGIYRFHFPDMRRRDCPNFEKLITDLLKTRGVLKDDSLIDLWLLDRSTVCPHPDGVVHGVIVPISSFKQGTMLMRGLIDGVMAHG